MTASTTTLTFRQSATAHTAKPDVIWPDDALTLHKYNNHSRPLFVSPNVTDSALKYMISQADRTFSKIIGGASRIVTITPSIISFRHNSSISNERYEFRGSYYLYILPIFNTTSANAKLTNRHIKAAISKVCGHFTWLITVEVHCMALRGPNRPVAAPTHIVLF
jgi:hypothetical protein